VEPNDNERTMIERDLSVLVSWVRRCIGRGLLCCPLTLHLACFASLLPPYRPYLLTHQLKQAVSMKPL
jgi:hypothetical protein